MQRPYFRLALALLIASVVVSGCSWTRQPNPSAAPRALRVVTSFYPLAYFTAHIGGERVHVTSLVPAGADPHSWEPSTATVRLVAQADLLIYNGAGFEPWVERLVRTAENGKLFVVEATAGMALQSDPHVWLDPVLAQQQVASIAAALAQADPDGQALFEANAARLQAELAALDESYRALAQCEFKTVVVTHPFFTYPAARYGLEQIAISGSGGHEAEPRAGTLAQLTERIRHERLTHIFAEPGEERIAETLAAEAGIAVLPLHPIETLTAADRAAGKDYMALLEQNLTQLRNGLGCS